MGVMTADEYRASLQALLPPGAAWPREPEAVLTQVLAALAEEFARVDMRGDNLLYEADPRTTYELLADWERVFGLPEPCVPAGQMITERRAALVTKVTALGGQSPAYFLALAARLGYTTAAWTILGWHFLAAADGFTAANATITPATSSIVLAASAADPQMLKSGLAFKGADYRYLVASLKRNAGSGWDGTAYYTTAGHGADAGYRKTIAEPAGIGGYVTAVWDLHALTAGGSDWRDSVVTGIRLDLGLGLGDDYEIDWIALAPTAAPDLSITISEQVGGAPHTWRINSALYAITEFTCDSPCTDPLRKWGNDLLECVMNRFKPAHSTLLFGYT